ncbi:RHS repeat-associated core domain-containing protein [Pseudomonas putida]|uniref:RHS repeat-associated core domain-containing protein n=1 Tax=Pseudomonas putida TaxID=303 RepID=UPI003D95A934
MPTQSRNTILFATDQKNSVLNAFDPTRNHATAYTPYGDSPTEDELQSQLRFNAELRESMTGCYLLGNGYRVYSPILMRFLNPDSWSPFGKGGLNAYAYCEGDSINRADPTGHAYNMLKGLGNIFGRKKSIVTTHIEHATHDIKILEKSIIKNKKHLSKLEQLENYSTDFIDRQNKHYLDNQAASADLSSNPALPPSYNAAAAVKPPSFQDAEVLEMIQRLPTNIDSLHKKVIDEMNQLTKLKQFRKTLKREKHDPSITLFLIRSQ